MQSKDAARIFGRIGFFLPLFLIFLISADAAFACPQHTSKAAYRTRTITTRTASTMAPVVISYRAPATYRRCGDNLIDTRGARYVAARGDRYRRDAGYVAVRNGRDNGYYTTSQKRYIAVRDVARYETPRYVAVRRAPAYVDSGIRYVAVRRAEPRVRYVALREFQNDGYNDEIHYVKMSRHRDYDSGTRYVAVRGGNAYYEAPRTRYVAVRNNINAGCARTVALQGCLDQVETMSARGVVIRDDGYSNRTKYVAVRDEVDYRDHEDFDESDGDSDVTVSGEIDDDAEYFVQPTRNVRTMSYVGHDGSDRYDGNGGVYLTSNEMGNPCMRQVAPRTCPETYNTRTISYAPVSYYDDDIDDQAFLDGGGATYVAAGDIEDACLSTVGVREVPEVVSMREVSYVPVNYADDHAFDRGSEAAYIETENAAHAMRYAAGEDDEDYVVEADEVGYVKPENDYIPVDDNAGAQAVSYVPVDDFEYVGAEPVSYVPAESAYEVDATYIAEADCPELISSVDAEPVYVADASAVLVEEGDAELVAGLHGTQQIAESYGFRDGFEDGRDAALERDEYHPENSGDFQKATEGYEDEYGDKSVYKDAYRNKYLQGYREGFESAAGLA